jgi:uncharacterized RDD family membrane protein YckC
MFPAITAHRFVTPETLNVAPGLVGRLLASPGRRAAAMVVDLAAVGLLSSLSNVWLVIGLALVGVLLRGWIGADGRWRKTAGWALVALFALLAVQEASTPSLKPARSTSPSVAVAKALADDGGDDDGPSAVTIKKIGAGLPDAQRIALLEAALAEAGKSRPVTLREELRRIGDAIGASFGWGIVYFSLLPALWNGQSLGKKFLRLQVVELTGQPMTVMRALKRYGGYAAGMATGGLGFTQLLWDPNRQAIQDRAAHTVVIDLRNDRREATRPP